jgi:uncharacterized protein
MPLDWLKKIITLQPGQDPVHFPVKSSLTPTLPSSFYPVPLEKRRIKVWDHTLNQIQELSIPEFEQWAGIRYLADLEYKNNWTHSQIVKQCKKTEQLGVIDKETRWNGAFYGKQIKAGHVADVTIKWVNDELGYGLFASEDMSTKEFIGEYTGVVKRKNLLFQNINDYCFAYPTTGISFTTFTIDSLDQGNEVRFLNHSLNPNCESLTVFYDGLLHVIIRTIKAIKQGEQLVYDYGDVYWDKKEPLPN